MSQIDQSLSQFQFSQVVPDTSEDPPSARAFEERNLTNLDTVTQSRLITDMSRLLLFKALSGEPIDRTKLTKEAWGERAPKDKMLNAAINKSNERMRAVFGMDVKQLTDNQLKHLPNKYKDRMYVVNAIKDDEQGSHSKALHGIHLDSAIEKGLLMLILAFIYCKGEVQNHVRWIPAGVLYRLLHSVDENIPAEPAMIKNKRESIGDLASPSANFNRSGGVGATPDVDVLLEKFVHMDYLLKKKADKNANNPATGTLEENPYIFAAGPRSMLEIGRRQIIYFCAEVLDEQPDPIMLQELAEEEGVEEEEEEIDAEMHE
jgi:hypothetical protein